MTTSDDHEHDDELPSPHGAGDDPADGQDPTLPERQQDPTLFERMTPPEGGAPLGETDADDDEHVYGVIHTFRALAEGEPALWCIRCEDLIGVDHRDLLRLEALAPDPSLTACANHFHPDLEII